MHTTLFPRCGIYSVVNNGNESPRGREEVGISLGMGSDIELVKRESGREVDVSKMGVKGGCWRCWVDSQQHEICEISIQQVVFFGRFALCKWTGLILIDNIHLRCSKGEALFIEIVFT